MPSGFVAAILGVFAELAESLGSLFAEPRADVDLWDSGLATLTSRYRSRALDTVFGGIFLGLFFAVMAGWLLVIAPLQYFLNLPCGAPAAHGADVGADDLDRQLPGALLVHDRDQGRS